jgi:hypothetical protein
MRGLRILARLRAAWTNLDHERRELERRIASYNTPDGTRAERLELDRALEQIRGRA